MKQDKEKNVAKSKKGSSLAPTPIEPVPNYPVHDLSSKDAIDPDLVLSHYMAGYLIVAPGDGSGLEQVLARSGVSLARAACSAPEATSSESEPEFEPEPRPEDHELGPEGVPPPNFDRDPIARTLCLKTADGQLAVRQILAREPDDLVTQVNAWRDELSSSLPASISNSDVNPDPGAWTLLGSRSVSTSPRGWFSPWYFNGYWDWYATGRSETTVSVYRLNSKDAFDYFLVKTLWTVSPHAQRRDAGGIWFFNRDHKLSIELSASTANGRVTGDLINFEPKTLATSQKYAIKFGGDLNAKISDKPEIGGKASAEISTQFEIPSVSVNALRNGAGVAWELLHDYGPGWGRGVGDNWPNTTISGATAVTWALYRFHRGINDARAPSIEAKVKLTGNFGSAAEKVWGSKQKLALPYASEECTLSFAVPTMSIEPVYIAQRPLEFAPGATATVRVKAGAPGLPLNWQVYENPKHQGHEYLVLSPSSSSLGDGQLRITALADAKPGTFGYVRINSLPRTATDSLRQGDLDLPVMIVEPPR